MNRDTKYQVTEWGDPDEWLRTSYGEVSYVRWLQLEIDRWDEKIDRRESWVEIADNGNVAMFTDWPGMKATGGKD